MKNRIFLFLILSLTLFKIVFGYEQTIEFSKKNIQVKLTSCLARTHFEIQANFSNETDLNKLWLGIIISTQIESYDGSNFVYCYRTNTSESVQQRYFDSENYNYTLFSNEFIGLNSLSVIKNENKVTCKFTRENSNVDYNYLNFDLNTFYIAADYGKYENKIPEFVNNTFDMVETVSITYNTNCEDYTTLDNENIFIKFRNLGAKTWYEATAVISKNISLDNIWFGLGINFNRKMPNANVVICQRNSTYSSVEHYYNEGLQPKYIDETNKFIGLSSTYLSVTNRTITCRFMRDNNNANSKYIYQNGENLYVLAAYGPFSNDIMSIHSLVKESKNIVSFPIRPVDEYFITLDNEKTNVTFKNCGSMTHFKVTALIENGVSIDNAWLGLGLNINNKMPGASVVVCKQGINLTTVEHYYNNGLNPEYLNSSNKFEGLSSVSVKIDGSFMICKFSRDNSNKNSKYMNLNTQKIFLSVAYGSLQKENILAHKKVVVSKNIVTFPVIPQCRRFTTLDNDRVVVYYENLGDRTSFEVQAETNYISSWIALGFRDEASTTYSLVMCKYNSTFNSVEHYSFDGQNLTYFNQSNIYAGLSNPIVSVSEKMISCFFTRDNFNPNRNYTYINNNNNLYLMVAYGPFINNDVSNYEVMVETLNGIEFPIENLLPEFNKAILNNGKIKVNYKNCGSYTHFEINALIENNIDLNNFWISLALNNRRDLINSNAVICRYQLDSYSIEHYYYNGSQPKLMNISQALRSTYLNVESSTRLVSCKFTRENTNPNNMYFNLNTEKLYIIVSYGKLNKQGLKPLLAKLRKVYPRKEVEEKIITILESKNNPNTKPQTTNYLLSNYKQIGLFISLCTFCNEKNTKSGSKRVVVKPIISTEFMNRGQLDLMDLQTMPDGPFKWIMHYQDHHNKVSWLCALASKCAAEVARNLIEIFCFIGPCCILQMDNGREFVAQVVYELKKVWPGLSIVHGRPRHPQSQGSVERANADVKNMLRAWMRDNNSTRWSLGLKFVQMAKNNSFHRTIDCPPY
ncbi:unnamed protein product [Brachionus calyciflorus]|uniref:Integrase catalytic domain-containing protein n=1 Tax=Brachionus calyciflorus TaxID=104777 RepID=A0A814I5V8_9BILA|nr:unnamed protein product [Brachionus calyciflorus]